MEQLKWADREILSKLNWHILYLFYRGGPIVNSKWN